MSCSLWVQRPSATSVSARTRLVLFAPRPSRCLTAASVSVTTTVVSVAPQVATAAPSSSSAVPIASPPAQPIPQLDAESFHSFLQTAGESLCVVDYYSDWCGPCQIMNKELDKLALAFPKRVKFAKLNCGNHPEFSTRQRIRSLPTFRLYYKGTCVDELTGARPVQLRQLLTHYSVMTSI